MKKIRKDFTNLNLTTTSTPIRSGRNPGGQTTWFRISAWGKLGENCNQYLAKGRQVFIEGELQPDKATGGPRIWTDNEGNARASFEVRARLVQFLGSADSQDVSQGGSQQSSVVSSNQVAEDEIPF